MHIGHTENAVMELATRIKVSFCTTVHNRFWQFQQVFDDNVAVIRAAPATEWIILNYNSSDGLHEYMMGRLDGLPENVIYIHETSGRRWHVSLAKNIAHRTGRGDILMNLDADQRIVDAPEIITPAAVMGAKVFHLYNRIHSEGTYGKIAMCRHLFYRLGGYDEKFLPMVFEDKDLLDRAEAVGAKLVSLPCPPNMSVRNTRQQSIQYCSAPGWRYADFKRANSILSRTNIDRGILEANCGRLWGGGCGAIYLGGSKIRLRTLEPAASQGQAQIILPLVHSS